MVFDDPNLPLARQAVAIHLEIVAQMHKAGIGILAGTDTPIPYCLAGFGLHDELQLLVRAGLTPMDAVRAATYKPAEFLGKLDSLPGGVCIVSQPWRQCWAPSKQPSQRDEPAAPFADHMDARAPTASRSWRINGSDSGIATEPIAMKRC